MPEPDEWAEDVYNELRTLFTLVGDRRELEHAVPKVLSVENVPPLMCQNCRAVVQWIDWPEHVEEHRRTVFGY